LTVFLEPSVKTTSIGATSDSTTTKSIPSGSIAIPACKLTSDHYDYGFATVSDNRLAFSSPILSGGIAITNTLDLDSTIVASAYMCASGASEFAAAALITDGTDYVISVKKGIGTQVNYPYTPAVVYFSSVLAVPELVRIIRSPYLSNTTCFGSISVLSIVSNNLDQAPPSTLFNPPITVLF